MIQRLVWKSQRTENAKAHAFRKGEKTPLCGHHIPGRLVYVIRPEVVRRCIPCLDTSEEVETKGARG